MRRLALLSLLAALNWPLRASTCEETEYATVKAANGELVEVQLDGDQIETIQAAIDSPSFKVNILNKSMPDGRLRTLVILGEQHLMPKQAEEIGHKILDKYQYIGTEALGGKENHNNIGDKAGLSLFASAVAAPALFYLMIKKKWTKLSLMFELKKRLKNRDDSREGIQKLVTMLEGKSEQELEGISFTINGDRKVSGKEILEILNRDQNVVITRINLEEGHSPDLKEQINSVVYPMKLIAKPVCLLAACGFGIKLAMTGDTSVLFGATSVSFGIYHFAHKTLQNLSRFTWFDRFPRIRQIMMGFDFKQARVEARDTTMAANANRAIQESNEDNLLAIVGMLHNDGMVRHLINDHGFTDIPLDQETPDAINMINGNK